MFPVLNKQASVYQTSFDNVNIFMMCKPTFWEYPCYVPASSYTNMLKFIVFSTILINKHKPQTFITNNILYYSCM